MNSDEETRNAELQAQVAKQKTKNRSMQWQVENMKLQNELDAEKLQEEQWEAALQQLKEARDKMSEEHRRNLEQIKTMNTEPAHKGSGQAVAWLQEELHNRNQETEAEKRYREKKQLLQDLQKQQEELQRKIADISGRDIGPTGVNPDNSQQLLLEQLRAALTTKETEKDPNKALLKALITSQNKTYGPSGTSTLKTDLVNRMTGCTEFSMAEWLASLNKQDEGESEVLKVLAREEESDCRLECRHSKMKSGMLDKSTTNIRHKEVWPQKNLGEDWAEEEIEFKQLKFEHLVAGETRTIETCTDPAQILGRLRLLRCIAYLKLRGIEWHLLRKMYAAILSSIETREYSWESNFDRFESILYRKVFSDRATDRDRDHKPTEARKRFCRDYNKPEGCTKTSPHSTWFGSGPSATRKTVYHYCAACLIRDKTPREHPEGHPDCPHRT